MSWCPRFRSYKEVKDWLERVGRRMARTRGLPPPNVGFFETIYVGGERKEVNLALYDFPNETIIINPREVRKIFEPTPAISRRFGLLRWFYHEFKHHEQYHRAGKDSWRAFDGVELKKPWHERKHEKQAVKESEKLWDKFEKTLDPLGELE